MSPPWSIQHEQEINAKLKRGLALHCATLYRWTRCSWVRTGSEVPASIRSNGKEQERQIHFLAYSYSSILSNTWSHGGPLTLPNTTWSRRPVPKLKTPLRYFRHLKCHVWNEETTYPFTVYGTIQRSENSHQQIEGFQPLELGNKCLLFMELLVCGILSKCQVDLDTSLYLSKRLVLCYP